MSHLEVAPYLLPVCVGTDVTVYSGFLVISDGHYQTSIYIPHNEGLSAARLECEWKLKQKVSHKTELIQQRLKCADSLAAFLRDFIMIAETCVKSSKLNSDVWAKWTEHVMDQIQELGWERLVSIDETFSSIELAVSDDGGRQHKIKLTFNKQNDGVCPVCITDLPETFNFHWSAKTRLKHIMQEFTYAIEAYQEFWNMIEEIDNKTWVLEPEYPTFASTQRRIALGANMSLHITVNCKQPSSLPECLLLGADQAVAPLRERLNVNLHRWDVERSLLNNLQEVLDIDFPSPTNTIKEDLSVDCGICYCLHMNDEIPDIICEDKRCAQAFHRSCLYEWLRSVSTRQSFNTVFGECPLCSHPIRVKMPT